MTVWAGVWSGLFVGVGVVLDDIACGVVAGPATGVDAVCAGIGTVHAGMDTKAIVGSVDVTEIVAVAVCVVVLGTAVMAAKTTRATATDDLDVVEIFGLFTVYCMALVATAVLGGSVEITEHVCVVDLRGTAPAGADGADGLVVAE